MMRTEKAETKSPTWIKDAKSRGEAIVKESKKLSRHDRLVDEASTKPGPQDDYRNDIQTRLRYLQGVGELTD